MFIGKTHDFCGRYVYTLPNGGYLGIFNVGAPAVSLHRLFWSTITLVQYVVCKFDEDSKKIQWFIIVFTFELLVCGVSHTQKSYWKHDTIPRIQTKTLPAFLFTFSSIESPNSRGIYPYMLSHPYEILSKSPQNLMFLYRLKHINWL